MGLGFGAQAVANSKPWRLIGGQLPGASPQPQCKEHLLLGEGKLGTGGRLSARAAGIPRAMNSALREPAQPPAHSELRTRTAADMKDCDL